MNESQKSELESLRVKPDKDLTAEERSRVGFLSLREKCDLRCKYGPLWDFCNFLFYKADPEGLSASGAPYDEYESEVAKILPEVVALYREKKMTTEAVKKIMVDAFVTMFGPPSHLHAGSRPGPSKQYTDAFDWPARRIMCFLSDNNIQEARLYMIPTDPFLK